MAVTKLEAKEGRGPGLKIQWLGGQKDINLRILRDGIIINPPVEHHLVGVKTQEEPLETRFHQAFTDAANALLNNKLAPFEELPADAEDALDDFDTAVRGLISSHHKKKDIEALKEEAGEKLVPLLRLRNIPRTDWEQCQEILSHRIKSVQNDFRERQYRRKAKVKV